MLKSLVLAGLLVAVPETQSTVAARDARAVPVVTEAGSQILVRDCLDALDARLPGTLQIEQPVPTGNGGQNELEAQRLPGARGCALV